MAQTWAFGTSTVKDQSGAGATTIVINKPASTVDGDLLIAEVNGDSTQTTQTGPAGWTQITGSPQTSGALKGSAWYKTASSEGASWTWTSTGGGFYWIGFVARWTGIQATPLDVSNGAANAGTTTVVAPAVTTTVTDDLVARMATTGNATSITFAAGTSRFSSGSNGDFVVLYDQNQATAATTGTDTATANAGNAMVAFTATFKQTAAATKAPVPFRRPYRTFVRRF